MTRHGSLIRRAGAVAGAAAVVACAVALSACSDPTTGALADPAARGHGVPKVAASPAVRRLVPEALRRRGTLALATGAPYTPMEFFAADNTTLTGFDIDLGDAIGEVMGLRTVWHNTSVDSIVPGLQAHKYDAAMSGFSITHERLGTVDMVSYYLSGGGFLIRRGSGVRARSYDSLCGERVAVEKGVSQVESLADASAACARRGRERISILQLPNENLAILALSSRRADVVVADKPQVEYAAKQTKGQMCVVDTYQTSHSIAGIALPKHDAALRRALQAAIDSLIRSGAYRRVADEWGTGQPQRGRAFTASFARLLAPWGVGRDGAVRRSRIFTKPGQISGADHYFYEPLRKECA